MINNEVESLLSDAISTLDNLRSGEKFIVKDLFRGYEWNRIERANRTRLGSRFFYYAEHDGESYITPMGKTPQNQQIYIKK
jgi:hypothetical protein